MLTNNGKAFLYARNYDNNYNTSTGIALVNRGNSGVSYYYYNGNDNYSSQYTHMVESLMIVVGSGNTAAAATDYNLENAISDSNLQVVSRVSRNEQNHSSDYRTPIIMHSSVTYQNNSLTDSFIIKEVGLITYSPSTNNLNHPPRNIYDGSIDALSLYNATNPAETSGILLAREVLSTPVTIAPGETATFTITVA